MSCRPFDIVDILDEPRRTVRAVRRREETQLSFCMMDMWFTLTRLLMQDWHPVDLGTPTMNQASTPSTIISFRSVML